MDKDELIMKLQSFMNFIIWVGIILAVAYFSGFLKGFTPDDFKDAFTRLPELISGEKYVSDSGNYQSSKISQDVIRGANTLYAWRPIFATRTKSVLYIYDENDIDFHNRLQNYIKNSPIKNNYHIYAYTKAEFRHVKLGESGPSKICNTFEECKEQQQRSAAYSAASSFFERCGKTMCVINPQTQRFVRLPKRDAKRAIQTLNALRNW